MVESGDARASSCRLPIDRRAPLLPEIGDVLRRTARAPASTGRRRARRRGARRREPSLELRAAPGRPSTTSRCSSPATASTRRSTGRGSASSSLPERETGEAVFDFDALGRARPATSTTRRQHRRADRTPRARRGGTTGPFAAGELLGLSEVGIVGDPPPSRTRSSASSASSVWDGTRRGRGGPGLRRREGEDADPLPGRAALAPDRRPAEAHPVERRSWQGRPVGHRCAVGARSRVSRARRAPRLCKHPERPRHRGGRDGTSRHDVHRPVGRPAARRPRGEAAGLGLRRRRARLLGRPLRGRPGRCRPRLREGEARAAGAPRARLLGDRRPSRRPVRGRPDRRAPQGRSCRPTSGATASRRACGSAPPSG